VETGAIALITGANKGIGYETARLLGAGDITVLLGARDEARGRRTERLLRDGGANAHFVQLDVTDDKTLRQAADRIDRQHGRLDILVNNAAIAEVNGRGQPSETTATSLRRVCETNVVGAVAVTNAMLPLLRRAPAARIVNVSSDFGSLTLTADPAIPLWRMGLAYPASKAALNMVTLLYAKELRDSPIKVNSANPGFCATDLSRHRADRTAAEAAKICAHLAMLPEDGPTGQFWGLMWDAAAGATSIGVLPW
jgi:NAD(P)-dependent dehydrogenase (short-subunit alcohol dehydrogenase family)